MIDSDLVARVEKIPELYQPIFGHPEFDTAPSRVCEDRLSYLVSLHDALREKLGRPLRVLDLGCAQGYFSLSLAERGAKVLGIDFLDLNVDVCRSLADEFPQFDITFECDRIEDVIERSVDDSYDIVLGLSVFHHVIHEHGLERTAWLMSRLADISSFSVFEFALASEPLYWAASLPKEERTLLTPFEFAHCLAYFPTHLSEQHRPLYACSRHYWFLGNEVEFFSHSTTESHLLAEGSHEGTRRYYFSENKLAKLLVLKGSRKNLNEQEYLNEVAFLTAPPSGRDWPAIYGFGRLAKEAWLVRQKLSGNLLEEIIRDGRPFDVNQVLWEVLQQLSLLEGQGLFHNDVRTWNVIIDDNLKASIIDYGSISAARADCVWPGNLILSFTIFVYEVLSLDARSVFPTRPPFISPYNFPEPYQGWLRAFWRCSADEWSYALFRDLFVEWVLKGNRNSMDDVSFSPPEIWMKAIEQHLYAVGEYQSPIAKLPSQLLAMESALDARISEVKDLTWAEAQQIRLAQDGLRQIIENSASATLAMGSALESRISEVKDLTWAEAQQIRLAQEGLRQFVENNTRVVLTKIAEQGEAFTEAVRQAERDSTSRSEWEAALRKELQAMVVEKARLEGALREAHAHAESFDIEVKRLNILLVQQRDKFDQILAGREVPLAVPSPPTGDSVPASSTNVRATLKGLLRKTVLCLLRVMARYPKLRSVARRFARWMPFMPRHRLVAFARHHGLWDNEDDSPQFVPMHMVRKSNLAFLNRSSEAHLIAKKLEGAIKEWEE